jgi:phenylpyruvate tautomerase PptA (4-oxalocrotonate tautomerase family)
MPSLQLDVPGRFDADVKRALAQRLSATYGAVMEAPADIVTVVIRDGAGVWRAGEPSALLMCDVRRGRSVSTREQLSRRLIADCTEALSLPAEWVKVEFTQHAGDEMFHPHLGGFNQEWSPE